MEVGVVQLGGPRDGILPQALFQFGHLIFIEPIVQRALDQVVQVRVHSTTPSSPKERCAQPSRSVRMRFKRL